MGIFKRDKLIAIFLCITLLGSIGIVASESTEPASYFDNKRIIDIITEKPGLGSSSNNGEQSFLSRSVSRESVAIEQGSHGGSWLDSFDNQLGVDLAKTDNINLSGGNVKLLNVYTTLFSDNFNGPLDLVKWTNHSGYGTTVYTYPIVKAVKSGSSQTDYCYIETKAEFFGPRIIEWDWNPWSDSASNGYLHSFIITTDPNEGFQFSIRPNRSVYVRNTTAVLYSSTAKLTAKTWYLMRMTINDGNVNFEAINPIGQIVIQKKLGADNFALNTSSPMTIYFAATGNSGFSFDCRLDNLVMYNNYTYKIGNVTSKKINLPLDQKWDKLILDKSEFAGNTIKVTVLDGSTNVPIAGFTDLSAAGELDISGLNGIGVNSIKLKAELSGDGFGTPSLNYWGASWKTVNTWRDTFFGGSEISSLDGLIVNDGSSSCSIPASTKGYLNSSSIDIPDNYYYNTLILNKTEPSGTSISVSIHDGQSGYAISGFTGMIATTIDLSNLNPQLYPKVQIRAVFNTNVDKTPVLFDYSLNWTLGSDSNIDIDLSPDQVQVYRVNSMRLDINAYYLHQSESSLAVEVEHKLAGTVTWSGSGLGNLRYDSNHWAIDFTPGKTAGLGFYSFRVKITDLFDKTHTETFDNMVEVLNNLPTKPDLKIIPGIAYTNSDLVVIAENSTDLEDELITYEYQWYKNTILVFSGPTTTVGHELTEKGDLWLCEVTPSDGNLNGQGTANTTSFQIQNSPPIVADPVTNIIINEDSVYHGSINLSNVFYDADSDPLIYEISGQSHLDVSIDSATTLVTIKPEPNWHGTEVVNFTAYDPDASALNSLNVEVVPQNDPPILISAGLVQVTQDSKTLEFQAYQDKLFELQFMAEDIDGDMISFSINRTDIITLEDDVNTSFENDILKFTPINEQVGPISLNLTVSDNNGSVVFYDILIRVIDVNDPPHVTLINPENGSSFEYGKQIELECNYTDIDMDIKDPVETLTITWRSDLVKDPLGSGELLANISISDLRSGVHNITVTVSDRSGARSSDVITIIIEEMDEDDDDIVSGNKERTSSNYLWIILIIIINIIIFVVIIMYARKKAKVTVVAKYIPETRGKPALVTRPSADAIRMPVPGTAPVTMPAPTQPAQLPPGMDVRPLQETDSVVPLQAVVQPTVQPPIQAYPQPQPPIQAHPQGQPPIQAQTPNKPSEPVEPQLPPHEEKEPGAANIDRRGAESEDPNKNI